MKQFYATYQQHEKLSAVLTQISWTNHLHILSKAKSLEEKEFYFGAHDLTSALMWGSKMASVSPFHILVRET